MEEQAYVEETFGILTDDDVYLDCVLVRPRGTTDANIKALRAWIPRYPLTKSSVITCARQEVLGAGIGSPVAHLVFDLRGTGQSEGQRDDHNFEMDLEGVRLWAAERFGDVNFGFLGAAPNRSSRCLSGPVSSWRRTITGRRRAARRVAPSSTSPPTGTSAGPTMRAPWPWRKPVTRSLASSPCVTCCTPACRGASRRSISGGICKPTSQIGGDAWRRPAC